MIKRSHSILRIISVEVILRSTVANFVLFLGILFSSLPYTMSAQDPSHGAPPSPSLLAIPVVPAGANSASNSDVYLINPGDSLDVYIFDVPELSRTYTVTPSGVVIVPLLTSPIQAAGLTPDQFGRAMEEAFRQSGRLKRPEIAVSLAKQSITSSVAVEGAVRNPQILSEIGRAKLVDIITQCGGLADDAGTTVTVTRSPLALRTLSVEGGIATATLTIELSRVMNVSDPASGIVVWPGDRVTVERQRTDVYYVLGEVKTPGGYSLKRGRDELTVLRALAIAGDVTSVAKKNKAMIIRKDPKAPQGRDEIKLDLESILKGHSPDPVLQADDIIFIPGSNGKKALHTLEGVPGQALGAAGASALIVH
jgi:polysaccharide biosynthesis/export protein